MVNSPNPCTPKKVQRCTRSTPRNVEIMSALKFPDRHRATIHQAAAGEVTFSASHPQWPISPKLIPLSGIADLAGLAACSIR